MTHGAGPSTEETFLPLSRGLRKYQRVYTPAAMSLYLWLLQGAEWRPGPDYGTVEATLLEMREGLALDRKTIKTALKELERGYPFPFLSRTGTDTAPAFILIEKISKRGRQTLYRIRILKAKLRLSDFDRFTGNGRKKSAGKSPEKTVGQVLEEKIVGGKIREIHDIVGNTADALDMKKHLGGKS